MTGSPSSTPATASPPPIGVEYEPSRRARNDAMLSFGQERLWVIDQIHPGSPAYIIPAVLHLPGPIQVPALERTINEIVRRHDSLRATIAKVDGSPVQRISPQLTVPLTLFELSGLPPDERGSEVQRLIYEENARSFDIATGPLVRSSLIRLSETDHILMISLHHIVSDAWSINVLFRELFAIYDAFARNEPSPLPDLRLQYADYAAWQRRHLSGDRLEELIGYWREKLAGAPPLLSLPTDRPRPEVQAAVGARQEFILPSALSKDVVALNRAERTTSFMTLLAAFDCVLYAHTGQTDLVVGSPIANRNRTEFEGLIGFFANTVVLRSNLEGNPTFRELLGRIRDTTLDAYAHQDLPFERLVDVLRIKRSMANNSIFQVLFNLQGGTPPGNAADDFLPPAHDTEPRIYPGAPKFDFELALAETPHGIHGLLEYNTDLFDHATMTALWNDFRAVLEEAVADPNVRLDNLSVVRDGELGASETLLIDVEDRFDFE